MRIRIPRPRQFGLSVRDLARRDPGGAEEYLDTHQDAWDELAHHDPHDAADILEALNEEGAAGLLQDLHPDRVGDVLDEMHPQVAADVLEELEPDEAATMIAQMEPDQAVDLIRALSPGARTTILAELDTNKAEQLQALLLHAADTAGGMMTTDVMGLSSAMSAGDAIEELRRLHAELGSILHYVYAVDDRNRLVGVISFRDLVFANPADALGDVINPALILVRTDTDRDQVSELIHRYRLLAVPVVDADGILVGIVKFSEAIEAIQAQASEDIALMVGAGEEETVFTPVGISVRRRLPWIFFNLVVGTVVAAIISQFRSTLTTYAVLAAYMPIVAQLSGNSGAQSLAIIIRSMATGHLPTGRIRRGIRREVTVGLIDGTAVALLAAGMAAATLSIFEGDAAHNVSPGEIATIVFLSVWVGFLVAAFVGAGIPMMLKRLRQDPAVASNIFLTMVTDIVGFAGFLATATLLLT